MTKKSTTNVISKSLNLSKSFIPETNPNKSDDNRISKVQGFETTSKLSDPIHTAHKFERGKRPQNITLVMNREAFLNAIFWVKIIDRLENELKRYNITMTISVTEDEKEQYVPIENNKADAYIILGLVEKNILQEIENKNLPVFLLDYKYLDSSHDHIRMNNHLGMKYMTELILKKGHRHILFMGDLDFAASIKERYLGIKDCLDEHPEFETILDKVLVTKGLKSIEERDSLLEKVRRPNGPTILVGANDMIALESINVLKKARIKVPEEISVVGFDNISESNFAEPKLTTVDVPKIDLAVLTVETIIKKFENLNKANLLIMIEPKIINRDSLIERRVK